MTVLVGVHEAGKELRGELQDGKFCRSKINASQHVLCPVEVVVILYIERERRLRSKDLQLSYRNCDVRGVKQSWMW